MSDVGINALIRVQRTGGHGGPPLRNMQVRGPIVGGGPPWPPVRRT